MFTNTFYQDISATLSGAGKGSETILDLNNAGLSKEELEFIRYLCAPRGYGKIISKKVKLKVGRLELTENQEFTAVMNRLNQRIIQKAGMIKEIITLSPSGLVTTRKPNLIGMFGDLGGLFDALIL